MKLVTKLGLIILGALLIIGALAIVGSASADAEPRYWLTHYPQAGDPYDSVWTKCMPAGAVEAHLREHTNPQDVKGERCDAPDPTTVPSTNTPVPTTVPPTVIPTNIPPTNEPIQPVVTQFAPICPTCCMTCSEWVNVVAEAIRGGYLTQDIQTQFLRDKPAGCNFTIESIKAVVPIPSH